MILNYTDFLFEYSNRKLQFNITELAKKYPNLISAKWDKDLNNKFVDLYENLYHRLREFKYVFNDYKKSITPEFRADCNAIGIAIDHILDTSNINQYISWFLYDGHTLKISPGGGKDFLGAKVLGFGAQKVVYQAGEWVLKKSEDVSTFEIYICNKYTDLFAKYVVAGNVVKQQKLEVISNITSSFFTILNELNDNIRDVMALEGFEYLLIDLHDGNVGYDGDVLKCFDFIYQQPVPIIDKTLIGSISLENLNKTIELDFDFFDDIDSPYRIINNTNSTNISGINIINNSKKEIYLNFTYKMLQPYLNDDLVIFGMRYVRND